MNSGADILILNHYGKDMINSLTQAIQFGLRDKQVNGKNFEIVVPLFSRLMAQGAGDNIKGILGSTNWNWSLKDSASQAFVKSFGGEYGNPPSMAAHTCYVQTLLYANACEMAGTFYPPEVIRAMEGFKFNGMGNGATEYRAAITSASRMFWWCVETKTRVRNLIFSRLSTSRLAARLNMMRKFSVENWAPIRSDRQLLSGWRNEQPPARFCLQSAFKERPLTLPV